MSSPSPASWRVILFTDNPRIAAFHTRFLPSVGHQLVGVVTSAKRGPVHLDVISAVPSGIDVLRSDHPRRYAAMLTPLRPDLIISHVFSWKLPPDLLALPTLGAVNVHPALLPRYRGTDTPYWLLRNGERQTGMTLHRMAAQLDVGPVLAQVPVPIDDDDTVESLFAKLAGAAGAVWEQALPRIAAGDPGTPQDEAQASYFPRIPDEAAWKTIDWTQPARTVHNVVRSAGFARELPPGAVGIIDGVPRRISRTRLVSDAAGDGAPGAIIGRDGETLLVQCGDGALAVVEHAQR